MKTIIDLMEENPEAKKALLKLKAFCQDSTLEEVTIEYNYKLEQSKNLKNGNT